MMIKIIHSGALGDVILLVRWAAAAWPGARIDVACRAATGRLLAEVGAVDAWTDIESLPLDHFFTGSCGGGDRLGDFLAGGEVLLSSFGVGDPRVEAALREQFTTSGGRRTIFLPARPPEELPGHLLEIWSTASGQALDHTAARRWSVPPRLAQGARQAVIDAGLDEHTAVAGRYAALHVGAGSREKCWPAERFAELAGRLSEQWRLPAVFLAGEVERERFDQRQWRLLESAGSVASDLDLTVLAGVIAASRVFIGNDSGPAHLAASLGAEGVALFGPSRAERFAPLTPAGRPIRTLRSPDGRMTGLRVEDVHSVIANGLQK